MAKIPFRNISKNKSSNTNDCIELMLELDELMPKFIFSDIFKRDIFEDSDENHYTETLIKFLEKKDSRFSFKPQASLPHRRSIDIGVHLKADNEHYIFNIEAKFLPPKDYVTGEYAAIKRFKKCEHGLSHCNPKLAKLLPQNAIVAYSKSGIYTKYLASINQKIVKLSNQNKPDKFGLFWFAEEQLKILRLNGSAKLKSKHQRNDKSEVTLYHFWVSVD